MTFDLYAAVSALRKNFPVLNDFERAVRIAEILQHKMSGRTLAKALGCSEKTVRNLSSLASAPRSVQQKLTDRIISTREALRLMKAAAAQKRMKEVRMNIELIDAAAEEVADKVTSWLRQWSIGFAEQIALEAKAKLINAANFGTLPKDRAPEGMPVDDIIAKCRPTNFDDEDTSFVNRYALWLARWVFFVAPDPNVHIAALDFVWEKTIARAA